MSFHAAFNMLMCSVKNRYVHRNKCLLVSGMFCPQVRYTLSIGFLFFHNEFFVIEQ